MIYYNGGYKIGIWDYGNFVKGKAKIIYSNGIYEGGLENNRENGYGEKQINDITYKGNYINGLINGKFTKIDEDGNVDSAEYEYGEKKSFYFIF